jgi:peptide/nickel transport system substrate-binding protein
LHAALGVAVVLLLVSAAPGKASEASAPAHPCLVVSHVDSAPFSRNFNPFGEALVLTTGGIYEPLVVVTAAGGGHQYNWLASGFSWSADRRTLTVSVRRGVRWTDGTPLTSRDVVYSLTAGKQSKVMDQIGLTRPGNEVASVRAVGTYAVAIRLRRIDSQFVQSVLGNHVVVVPEHVFADVQNVGVWTNPNPVGTGPFAVVDTVGTQSYVLRRNPNYWQRGLPRFPCIERIASYSGESALLQAVNGDVDLTDDLVPNAQAAYVAHDPAHFHYYYPAHTPGIGLFFDDTVYPFSLVALRKAISLAIDRQGLALAEYHYAPTVDALGIDHVWPTWIPRHLAAEANALATYNRGAARQTLLAAGFRYNGSALLDPHGTPVVMNTTVIASWSDWYADWGLIAADLRRIGITVNVDVTPDVGAWFQDAFATRRATLLWNTAGDEETPYAYFAEHLDTASFVPSGQDASQTGNWEHFSDARATRLLARFRSATDTRTQHRIAAELEQIWLDTLPFVPLFASPLWSTYSTRYFVGFPSATNDYIQPEFSNSDYVVALTRIRPSG